MSYIKNKPICLVFGRASTPLAECQVNKSKFGHSVNQVNERTKYETNRFILYLWHRSSRIHNVNFSAPHWWLSLATVDQQVAQTALQFVGLTHLSHVMINLHDMSYTMIITHADSVGRRGYGVRCLLHRRQSVGDGGPWRGTWSPQNFAGGDGPPIISVLGSLTPRL